MACLTASSSSRENIPSGGPPLVVRIALFDHVSGFADVRFGCTEEEYRRAAVQPLEQLGIRSVPLRFEGNRARYNSQLAISAPIPSFSTVARFIAERSPGSRAARL